jgi:very-short-patch-repair endonuclease
VDLLASVDSLSQEAAAADRLLLAHGPELPEGRPPAEVAATLAEIVAHLESGGTLGVWTKLTHWAWQQLQESCRVDGRLPQTLAEFQALLAQARLEESRARFAARWQRQVESLGGPPFKTLGRRPERSAQAHADEIRQLLEWRATVWEPLIAQLRAAGFRWDAWLAEHSPVPGDHGELTRLQRAGSEELAAIIEAQAARMRLRGLSAALERQRTYLAGFPQSTLAAVLVRAQDEWDIDVYGEACHELARLEGLRTAYATRNALLARLQRAAPSWGQAIAQREKPHDRAQPPGEPRTAWRWRQWYEELERRANLSMPDLQARLGTVDDELRRLAGQTVERDTWAAQCERTGLPERQNLMGFVQTMRMIGKGKGKRVPELLRKARELLASARRAVPVWIMPLSRVYDGFDPRDKRFDVVIIDEASQSDVTALAALYLGNEHIVVGDPEQVTPDAIGQRVDDVERMIATYLQGVPNSHLYDGQTSVYDLAQTAFGSVVALREHFRCVPEIIHFSNLLSYDLRMRPLREPSSAPVRPAVVAHRVQGFRDDQGETNEVEAEEIASLLIACLRDEAYARNDQGKLTTFGVISLLGENQALLIESKLRQRLQPDQFDRHRILCGNAAHFQGDERDVVFLSIVDGPPDDGTLRLLEGARNMFKKRYNVAASRARNQLWVVHSLDPSAHLKAGDVRRRLIEHARDPDAALRAIAEQGNRVESVFERQVLERLLSAAYRVIPAWPVGASFRIDLVVEGTRRRLAVECDGERWHTHEELQHDLERQAILERLGWVFVRIRGNLFFRDPERAMAPVFAKLDDLGIEPLGPTLGPTEPEAGVVVERVRREAESLREEWRREKPEQLAFGFSETGTQEPEPAASSVSKPPPSAAVADGVARTMDDQPSATTNRGGQRVGGGGTGSAPSKPGNVPPAPHPDEDKTLGALKAEWRVGLERFEARCGFRLPRPVDWKMTLREARARYGGGRK